MEDEGRRGPGEDATIEESGKITGELSDKEQTHYQSRIPTALNDNTLAADLEQHDVDVKGKANSTSFGAVLASFLPLVILVGLFFWISRRASRQLAGGIMGIGASRAKVYDEERPTTRFADVAGYEGAKREISEVVDFLTRSRALRRRRGDDTARRADGRAARDR